MLPREPGTGAALDRVVWLDEIDSTNAEGLRRAGDVLDDGPFWIAARRQTAGRGRDGRPWRSGDGNLLASAVIAPACTPSALPQLSFVAGVAAHMAVADMLAAAGSHRDEDMRLELKWPNDLMIGGAKLAGLLVEATTIAGSPVAVIGFGINLATPPAIANRATIALRDVNVAVAADHALRILSQRLHAALTMWSNGAGFKRVCSAWLDRAHKPGACLAAGHGTERIEGRFAGLADDGALLLETRDGRLHRLSFGDIDRI